MHLHNQFNDDELLVFLKEGQEFALTAVYRKHWLRLFTTAHHVLKDAQDCEDIIQEIFLKLWLARGDIQIKVSLLAYLYASVRYEVFRQIKAGKVREDIFNRLSDEIQAETSCKDVEYQELNEQIRASVEQLPDKCKAVYKSTPEKPPAIILWCCVMQMYC
jgi:RNA polymerase sigma factor (sigma-70 family)